jgi:hypothetical protein
MSVPGSGFKGYNRKTLNRSTSFDIAVLRAILQKNLIKLPGIRHLFQYCQDRPVFDREAFAGILPVSNKPTGKDRQTG